MNKYFILFHCTLHQNMQSIPHLQNNSINKYFISKTVSHSVGIAKENYNIRKMSIAASFRVK